MNADSRELIAIVGSACRFPGGANSPSELWNLLQTPPDLRVMIPPDRFNVDAFHHPDGSHHSTTNVRHSYLLQEDVRLFDPSFFNISPKEAYSMDPQQRLLLEIVYEALEAGGHTVESMRGSDTAIFTGTMDVDYHLLGMRDVSSAPTHLVTGINRAILSNRVSYFFDWHGHSMTIDTACSSSLVAVHQGVQALRSGESRVAVVCGTNILLNPETYIIQSSLQMLSPTGRSRMWDADADGYARGEGVAAVVLKRLSDAIMDGDHIECIIRETGLNQDGRSNGITVPSTEAQAALIRQTYTRAGLHPETKPLDRPQFFEAHGTGTKVGDPKEAAAIYQTLGQHGGVANTTPLYVGSVKTVIGHLEGSAGLAGLLKCSLSIQNGFIPPNLLLNRLNPDIAPFYKGVKVPTQLTAWPQLPDDVPRRGSVNSFGFGGTNAHAILEQYRGQPNPPNQRRAHAVLTPFVFSAASQASLTAQLQAYSKHLKTHGHSINISDLSWTLQARRSQLPHKTFFSALTVDELAAKIDARLALVSETSGTGIGVVRNSPKSTQPGILGIFTGQGAQWAGMMTQLILSSDFARQRIHDLGRSLATLSIQDRPDWCLYDEILKDSDISRIQEPAFSQPLCTAIQIVLVDLLKQAGVTFSTVVGHSSGEIAAAYAANFISADDAIRIAYLRGRAVQVAGPEGTDGAMLAVGTSWEDANEVIGTAALRGRVAIAAHNSAASVTLSGDYDAIHHAKGLFEEQWKFTRLLRVEVAYHSHHMMPYGEPYLDAMRRCGIRVLDGDGSGCTWFSSVIPGQKSMERIPELKDLYWRDNMMSTVRFSDAVKNAITNNDHVGLILEVGPHPALKGPTRQNIADVRTAALPYSGVLDRGSNDIVAFADALGFLWTHLGPKGVDLESFSRAAHSELPQPQLVTSLPCYQWDHTRSYWAESYRSRRFRGERPTRHELLGSLTPESTAQDLRWSNILKVSEVPWLSSHRLQGQIVFPASGYIAMALEACMVLAAGETVALLELHDLSLTKAMTFDEEDPEAGIETLVTLTDVQKQPNRTVTASFTCQSRPMSTSSDQYMDMGVMATGAVTVSFGTPNTEALLSGSPLEDYNMSPVDTDRMYSSLATLGYDYAGPFRTMASAERKLGYATGRVGSHPASDTNHSSYLVHPSTIDVAFHAGLVAYSAPSDQRLSSLHVPTFIRTVRLNPEACASPTTFGAQLPVCATINNPPEGISTSIEIRTNEQHTLMQIEDLILKAIVPATAADDRAIYSSIRLGLAAPDGVLVTRGVHPTVHEVELALACERLAYYYIRKWDNELENEEWESGPTHHTNLRGWVKRTLAAISRGKHGHIKKEWATDGPEDMEALASQFSDEIGFRMCSTVGESLVSAVRSQTILSEHALDTDKNNIIKTSHGHGLTMGHWRYNQLTAAITQQISHRYPLAKIFEIGAGNCDGTKTVLQDVGHIVSLYTCTDILPGFTQKAANVLSDYSEKMVFGIYDVEQSPESQGYAENSYDLVVASNVLHATKSIYKTLQNARKLLKPGGYLLIQEVINDEHIRSGFLQGSMPSWWVGVNDGRPFAPTMTSGQWHRILRKTGFGGIDTITPEIDPVTWPLSVMVTQAVDDRVQFLRRPLSAPKPSFQIDNLVILGSQSLETAVIAEELGGFLGPFCDRVTILDDLPTDNELLDLAPMSTLINLVDIQSPIFQDFTGAKMKSLQRTIELSRFILWVTHGALTDQPYHSASVAFGRAIRRETPYISFNQLDISDIRQDGVPKQIAEHVLQLYALEEWEASRTDMGQDALASQPMLWSKEPEVYFENDTMLIPRLLSSDDQNQRLNCLKRVVTKTAPIASFEDVSIVPSRDGKPAVLVELATICPQKYGLGSMARLSCSSLMALRVLPDTFLFLAIGNEISTGTPLLLLSARNSREISPVARVAIPVEDRIDGYDSTRSPSESLLIAAISDIIALSVIQPLASGSRLLVHCCSNDRVLTAALARHTAARGVRVTFVHDADTTDASNLQDPTWLQLSAREPMHAIQKKTGLAKPTHFLDLAPTSNSGEPSRLSLRIAQALPSGCKQIGVGSLYQDQSAAPTCCNQDALVAQLHEIASGISINTQDDVDDLIIPLSEVPDRARFAHATTAVRWSSDAPVTVQVRPLDARGFFSKEKTYIMAGLSGKIGQSLTEWIVSNGAGCVCLTSRRPAIDEKWLQSVQASGAMVKTYAMDVTDINSVERVIAEIRRTCPPIAGVANGAMVLDDVLFYNMSPESMNAVLAPKVDGSKNLDQVLYNDKLDFFVLFSSVGRVVGNIGQSNYAAANGYMSCLATQRRRRGVVGSAFDIGRVSGIGYVESTDRSDVLGKLLALGMDPISETDLREAFAETIRAGYLDLNDQNAMESTLTTGIRCFTRGENVKGSWFDNPLYSHRILESRATEGTSREHDRNTIARKLSEVLQAKTLEDALEVLLECFEAQLRTILRFSDQEINRDAPLVQLGIDSLAAVEVRSWFLKELKVDLPVLKVVGGASLADLCRGALDKLLVKPLASSDDEKASTSVPDIRPTPSLQDNASEKTSSATEAEQSASTGTASGQDETGDESSGTCSSTSSPNLSCSSDVGDITTLSQGPNSLDHHNTASSVPSESCHEPQLAQSPTRRTAPELLDRPPRRFVKSVPISLAQSRFWFLRQLLEDDKSHNVACYYKMTNDVNTLDMGNAVRIVASRHESLRSCFMRDENDPSIVYQKVLAQPQVHLECKTVSSTDEVDEEYKKLKTEKFDLESSQLVRLVLLTLSASSHIS